LFCHHHHHYTAVEVLCKVSHTEEADDILYSTDSLNLCHGYVFHSALHFVSWCNKLICLEQTRLCFDVCSRISWSVSQPATFLISRLLWRRYFTTSTCSTDSYRSCKWHWHTTL